MRQDTHGSGYANHSLRIKPSGKTKSLMLNPSQAEIYQTETAIRKLKADVVKLTEETKTKTTELTDLHDRLAPLKDDVAIVMIKKRIEDVESKLAPVASDLRDAQRVLQIYRDTLRRLEGW